MKVIEFNTPDGVYQLPLIKVAEKRAVYYACEVDGHEKDSEAFKTEVAYVMNDSYEGINWLLNNSDYEDWEEDTHKLNSEVKVLAEDFWCDSDDFDIKEILPFY